MVAFGRIESRSVAAGTDHGASRRARTTSHGPARGRPGARATWRSRVSDGRSALRHGARLNVRRCDQVRLASDSVGAPVGPPAPRLALKVNTVGVAESRPRTGPEPTPRPRDHVPAQAPANWGVARHVFIDMLVQTCSFRHARSDMLVQTCYFRLGSHAHRPRRTHLSPPRAPRRTPPSPARAPRRTHLSPPQGRCGAGSRRRRPLRPLARAWVPGGRRAV